MTDPQKTPEALAAKRLTDAIREAIDGWKGTEVAVAAFGQAQQSQAALNGLVRLLLHKGILSAADLGDSMRWSYDERTEQLLAMKDRAAANDSSLILPPAPTARGH